MRTQPEINLVNIPEFDALKVSLKEFFISKNVFDSPTELDDAIEYLFKNDDPYECAFITPETLHEYFPNEKVDKILRGDTFFNDLNKKANYGNFKLQFSDKLLKLIDEKKLDKKTCFVFEDKMTPTVNGYQALFLSNQDYQNGVALYLGELVDNCLSIGKSASDLCLLDALSDNTRTMIIKKDNKIVGLAPVYLDKDKQTIVITSLKCLHDTSLKTMKELIEYFSIHLMELNPDVKRVAIGIGGSSLWSMGFKSFSRNQNGEPTPAFLALGKVRYASNQDLQDLRSEIDVIKSASSYPVVEDSFSPADADIFLRSPTGAKKDFIRVAEIVNKENMLEKKMAVEKRISAKTRIDKPVEQNAPPDKVKNFMKVVNRYLSEEIPDFPGIKLHHTTTRQFYFTLPVANEADKAKIISKFHNLGTFKISALNPGEVELQISQRFFGLRRTRVNDNGDNIAKFIAKISPHAQYQSLPDPFTQIERTSSMVSSETPGLTAVQLSADELLQAQERMKKFKAQITDAPYTEDKKREDGNSMTP